MNSKFSFDIPPDGNKYNVPFIYLQCNVNLIKTIKNDCSTYNTIIDHRKTSELIPPRPSLTETV